MSAFRKASSGDQILKGTRVSVLNGSTLTSTGVASLDELFGGGLPMSRILLLKCDRDTGYHKLLLKYFVSEGIEQNHDICLVSLDANQIINDLMAVVDGKSETVVEAESKRNSMSLKPAMRPSVGVDKMSIAWRYQNTGQLSTELGANSAKVINGIQSFNGRLCVLPHV